MWAADNDAVAHRRSVGYRLLALVVALVTDHLLLYLLGNLVDFQVRLGQQRLKCLIVSVGEDELRGGYGPVGNIGFPGYLVAGFLLWEHMFTRFLPRSVRVPCRAFAFAAIIGSSSIASLQRA